jgi:cytochrome c oxidase subunit 4
MISIKAYFTVFIALLALTALTTGVSFVDLGGVLNVAVALVIAVTKALLVALYFMHLRGSSPLTVVFAGSGIFWLAILIALTAGDYLTRG